MGLAATGEVSTSWDMIRHRDARLRDMLRHYRTARVRRAREMLARLAALGMPLSWERVQALAGRGSTGRPHVARALLEEGYVSSVAEAFARYLRPGMPAYVPRDKASPAEVMAAIHAAGGCIWPTVGSDKVTASRRKLDGLRCSTPATRRM